MIITSIFMIIFGLENLLMGSVCLMNSEELEEQLYFSSLVFKIVGLHLCVCSFVVLGFSLHYLIYGNLI